jgi:hypothetical protein
MKAVYSADVNPPVIERKQAALQSPKLFFSRLFADI